MSECTTCSYYGKHLKCRAEDMPWPCVECAGGEKYVERGKRKHQVLLRVQLAELEARHNALVEAVHGLLGSLDNGEFKTAIPRSIASEMAEKVYRINRAEVDRLLSGDK